MKVQLELNQPQENTILVFTHPLGHAEYNGTSIEVHGIGSDLEIIVREGNRTERYRTKINPLVSAAYRAFSKGA